MKPEKKAKKIKAKSEKVEKKKGSNTFIIGILAIIILAGVAYAVFSFSNPDKSDNYQKTQIKLPSYAYTNPTVLEGYTYATEHPDLLEQIPCYCGCGGHSGHRFLRDCYIHDDWAYDDHASFCDVCIGEAIKVKSYLASGKTLKEARALIDEEYSKKGGDRTNTPPVSDVYKPILMPKTDGIPAQAATPARVDLSTLNLPENFRNLADGLNLTPAGANRAYFINTKVLAGTQMEAQYVQGYVQADIFYGKKIIGMYSADFTPTSWIELHDLGYDSTGDSKLTPRSEQGMKNIVSTRPIIYGHSQNADNVIKLMNDPSSMAASYTTYKPVLSAVEYQNAGVAQVMMHSGKFSDIHYWSMTPANGKVELVEAFNITDNRSIPQALDKYSPAFRGSVLVIKVMGDLQTVQADADAIDSITTA